MPLDASTLREQVAEYADLYRQTRRHREERLAALCAPLRADFLHAGALLETCRAAAQTAGLRWTGALFDAGEPINRQFPFGHEPDRYALIAVDGSQILPDRHKPFVYAYVQAGCAGIVYGEPHHSLVEKLRRTKRSQLIGESELFDERTGELKPPAEVANRRDVLEVELLAQACWMARECGLRPVLVADGSLVPFSLLVARGSTYDVERMLRPLRQALGAMRECAALVCGYIDRPNSNSIARACALAGLTPDRVTERTLRECERDLAGIFDRHLLERELAPSHRTAMFDPRWEVNAPQHLGEHAVRACYVNLGEPGRPIIARIEVPQWCAGPEQVGALCAVLHRHARLGEGYPLILKAAHEEAVVSKEDQHAIEQVLEQALLARGILTQMSFKQAAKDRG